MALNTQKIIQLAEILDQGLLRAQALPRLTEQEPEMSLKDAYLIQAQGIGLRCARGERVIGYKMGLTSKAKQEQMNLKTPIYGVLTNQMQVVEEEFSLRGKIHPKIEPEIAFWVNQDLSGPISLDQALSACQAVCPALEILDSRYVGFKYFSLPDVVADNSSSAYFVLGQPLDSFKNLDLENLEMKMTTTLGSETVTQQALSNVILGNPLYALMELSKLLAENGSQIKKGSIVLAGAAMAAIELKPGLSVGLNVKGFSELKLLITA